MPTISEIRQKYPQYDDVSDADLATALHSKFYADMPREEFDAKIGFNAAPPTDIGMDAAKGFSYGANTGIDASLNMIGAVTRVPMNYASRALGYGDVFPELEAARRFNVAGGGEGTVGRAAEAVGEVAGGSLLPGGAMLKAGQKAGTAASGILGQYARNPGTAASLDAASTAGAGSGVAVARENELGPVGEIGLGLVGGVLAPNAANMAARTISGGKSAGRYASQAMQSARDPESAAYRNVADKGVQSGLDFEAMRDRISPDMSANLASRNFTKDDIADIISRQLRGEHAEDIALDYKIAAQTARDYLKRYQDKNPTPLNVVDVAKLTAGEGKALPITRYARAVHSIGGADDASMAENLISRQEMQPARAANIIEKRMGGGDFVTKKKANADALQQESKKAYDKFYKEPDLATKQLDDLIEEPLFRNAVANAQRQERLDIIKRNQLSRAVGRQEEPVPQVDAETEVFSPQMLDLIQRDLRLTGEAFTNPNEANYARNIRDVFLDRIEHFYPSFRPLRQTYASGKMEQNAFDAGIKLSTKLGAPTREALADYETMTAAQKAIFRDSFGAALQEKVANTPRGNQATNQFSSQGFRQIIEKLYPKSNKKLYAEGQKLLNELNVERVTTKSKNDILSGSRTAELAGDMDVITTPAEAAANAFSGNWLGILRTLHKRLAQQIGTEGAKQSMKILGETAPDELLPILTRLAKEARSTQERQAYVATMKAFRRVGRRPAAEIGTITAGAPQSDSRR